MAVENAIILAVESKVATRVLGEALHRFLARPDICCVAMGSGQEHQATGCVGWSSRSGLCAKPELIWLAGADVAYLRLPVTIVELRGFLRQVEDFAKAGAGRRTALTPLGQLVCALAAAARAADAGDDSIHRRTHELQRFVREHWPGVFDSALEEVEEHLVQGTSAEAAELLRRVGREAPSAACYHCLQWLVDSDVRKALDEGIAIVLLQATQTSRDLADTDPTDVLDEDWWSPALTALRASETRIRETMESETLLPADLVESLRLLSEGMHEVEAICTKLTARGRQRSRGRGRGRVVEWKKLASLCQQVSYASAHLRLDSERVRAALESRSAAGPRSGR